MPCSAGRAVPRSTTVTATAATIAARATVSGGGWGRPSTVTEVAAMGGASRRPRPRPSAVAAAAIARCSTSSTSRIWRGVTPIALSVPTWWIRAAMRPATSTAAVAMVRMAMKLPAANRVPARMSMSECDPARRCCQVSR
jgi:hypothetical protein